VELSGQVERMIFDLAGLHTVPVIGREDEPGVLQVRYILRVYFVPVAVPFYNLFLSVQAVDQGSFGDIYGMAITALPSPNSSLTASFHPSTCCAYSTTAS
jgi:hypothetical protein